MGYVSCSLIAGELNQIKKGDIIYLVSDILELAKQAKRSGERFDRKGFLDGLMEVLGEEGTLMLPTFNWGFCRGETFDYKRTRCETGALGGYALTDSRYVRTKHPIYSFAVRGKMANELAQLDPPNSFGEGSLFDYMYKNSAKALVVGLPPMRGLTLLHHAEQVFGVPFRYNKEFTADYIDQEGNLSRKTYSMYVRDLAMDAEEQTEPFDKIMGQLGVCQTTIINGVPFHVMELREVMELLRMDIQYNDCRNIYRYKGQPV